MLLVFITMYSNLRNRPLWLLVILLACIGAKGCPTQVGCSVSGSLPNTPRGFEAEAWTCQVGVQLAKGASIISPGQAKADLLAKKEATTIQVAALREQLGRDEERAFGFGQQQPDSQSPVSDQERWRISQLEGQLKTATGESEKLDEQVQAVEALRPPQEATPLDGTWTVQDNTVTFHTVAPYSPDKKFVVPYVIRSEQGEILETGFLPIESVRVEERR